MTRPDSLNRSRQYDIFRAEQAAPVTLIGAGGIGSPIALTLAKMGVEDLTVYDHDVVEPENLPNQWYRTGDLLGSDGRPKPKVSALAEGVRDYAGIDIQIFEERYVDQLLRGVVIAAVDSMSARATIWEQVKHNPEVDLFVDARMGGLLGIVIAVRPCDPDDIKRYESRLYGDDQVAPELCTARAIIFNTVGIAAVVAGILRKWWTDGTVIPIRTLDWDNLSML